MSSSDLYTSKANEATWVTPDTVILHRPSQTPIEIAKIKVGSKASDDGTSIVPVKQVSYRPGVFNTDDSYNHKMLHYKTYAENTPLADIRADIQALITYSALKPSLEAGKLDTGSLESMLQKIKAIYSQPDAESKFNSLFTAARNRDFTNLNLDKYTGVNMPEPKLSVTKRAVAAVQKGAAVGLIGASNRKVAKTITAALAPNLPDAVPEAIVEKGIELAAPLLIMQVLEFKQVSDRIPPDMLKNIQTAATYALESGTADGVDKIATELMNLLGPMLMEYAEAGKTLNALKEPEDVFEADFSSRQRERDLVKEL